MNRPAQPARRPHRNGASRRAPGQIAVAHRPVAHRAACAKDHGKGASGSALHISVCRIQWLGSGRTWGPAHAASRRAGPLRLDAHHVDVFVCRLDARPGQRLDACLPVLSRAERARARGFRSPQAGLQFVAGRFLARSSLSLYRSVPPRAWRFKLNDHGRPEVDWPRAGHGLSFNISHTNGLAAVAVTSGCEIGLDVERIDRCVDFAGVAASVFTPRETDDVLLREPDGVAERFFDLWTLKEAYIKARGLGFSLSPASFEVPRGDAGIALRCMPECDPSPGRWQFHLSTHDGVRMAVAVGSRSVRCIRLFECAPPGRARSFFLRELSP